MDAMALLTLATEYGDARAAEAWGMGTDGAHRPLPEIAADYGRELEALIEAAVRARVGA